MYHLTCDTCGRVGNEDDGIEAGGPCQEPCTGTVRAVFGRLIHRFGVDVDTENGLPVSASVSDVESNDDGIFDQERCVHIPRDEAEDADGEALDYLAALLSLPQTIHHIYATHTTGDGWDIDIMSDLADYMNAHNLWDGTPEANDD